MTYILCVWIVHWLFNNTVTTSNIFLVFYEIQNHYEQKKDKEASRGGNCSLMFCWYSFHISQWWYWIHYSNYTVCFKNMWLARDIYVP